MASVLLTLWKCVSNSSEVEMLEKQTVVHSSCKWEWNFKATPKAKNMDLWLSLRMSLVGGFITNTQQKVMFEEINIIWLQILAGWVGIIKPDF